MGPGAVIAETDAGDAVLIVHDDPVALAQAARHIMDEVYQAPGQPRLRVALHYGEVQTRRGPATGAAAIAGGEAILCASLGSSRYVRARADLGDRRVPPGALAAALAVADDAGAPGRDGGDRFNVKKARGTEPDLWVRLYRLEL